MSEQRFAWLLELPGPLYLSTAVSDASVGFTSDPWAAWQFPTQATAELVAKRLNGAFGAKAEEHGFIFGRSHVV